MNSYERKRRICKMIVLVLGILSINNIILTIRNYSYAYFEKNVKTGVKLKITTLDEMPVKEGIAIDIVKATFGKTSGVIGVTNDSELATTESDNIREYRYSGIDVNNYIYFNCQDETTYKDAGTNCELWRIIGVFKDENGNEQLKIVRNNKLSDNRIWDNSYHDWANSDLKEYLNTIYYNTLATTSKKIIEETKYFLGSVQYVSSGDNPKTSYNHEREVTSCVNNIGSNASEIGCRVWNGHQATWTGNIALLYPSDYGFTASSDYWSTNFFDYQEGASNSWFYESSSPTIEWFLSPPSHNSDGAVCLWSGGGWYHFSVTSNLGIRPTLYLKSNIKIIKGDGTSLKPYFLSIE